MTDHEFLLAIFNMIEPIKNDVHEINCRVSAIEKKVDTIETRVTAIESKVDAIETRVTAIESKVDAIETQVDAVERRVTAVEGQVIAMCNRLKKMEIVQENEILPRLNTIEACYTSTYDRYKDSVEDYAMMKQDVSVLKKVVSEHSQKLQMIG